MHVIFSVDNAFDLRVMKLFLRYADNSMVLSHAKDKIKPLVGCYKGDIEPSFITTWNDYLKVVLPSGYVDNQESVLVLNKNPNGQHSCWFEKPSLKYYEDVKVHRFVPVSKNIAFNSDGWTYDPEAKQYWVVT